MMPSILIAMLLLATGTALQPSRVACARAPSRAEFLSAAVAVSALAPPPRAARAVDAEVTDVVALELRIAGADDATAPRIEIGLFGRAAPEAVGVFLDLARGELRAPCAEADESGPYRIAAGKRRVERECRSLGGLGVSYVGSAVWRIVRGKRVDFGRVSSDFAARVPPTTAASDGAESGLRHDAPGVVSMRRGGGAFEFTIAPAANPALDRENVVVGRVLRGLDVLARLDQDIPVKRGAIELDPPPLGAPVARACAYDKGDTSCAQFKPLRKVTVVATAVRRS